MLQAVINSTITPNMMFTKTSQKFGQWSDIRANTVYGLGFGSEAELNKFIEKFQEIKEATRSAATNHSQHESNVTNGTPATYSSGKKDENDLRSLDLVSGPGSGLFGHSSLSHQRSQSLSHLQASRVSPAHLRTSSLIPNSYIPILTS